MDPNYSLQDFFDYFRSQSNLSDRTLLMYSYALQHFFAFLEGSRTAEPLSIAGKNAPEQPLARLGASRLDVNMLSWFVNYLGKEAKSAKPHRRKAGDAFRLEAVRFGDGRVALSNIPHGASIPRGFPVPRVRCHG